MLRAIKAIYNGLKAFFNIIYTVVTFIPRLFSFLIKGTKTLFDMASLLPSGIVAIGIFLLAVALFALVIEIVRG